MADFRRITEKLTWSFQTTAGAGLVDVEIVFDETSITPREVVHATSDDHLVELWLHGRPETTRRAYEADAIRLRGFLARPLRATTVGDLQAWVSSLDHLAPASQARKIAAMKSLISFAAELGYLPLNIGQPIHVPAVKNRLAERIVEEAEVQRLIQLEPNARNNALLRLMYGAGLRISEACALRWRDMKGAKSGGQATVFGKGGKTRVVLIQPKLWRSITALRGDAGTDDPVFRSQRGGSLDRAQVHRIVKAAAHRAGVTADLSAHWLRHAHASHALDHGAPLHVLQGSLGHASLSTTSRYVHARPGEGSAKYLPE
ncbi:Integrase/recombinase (XerC/CodV family) [Granulibacter bethesdensis]|nr:Integrase/recombinase (XerC/CodV family) [Granulibacter bethesdensis]